MTIYTTFNGRYDFYVMLYWHTTQTSLDVIKQSFNLLPVCPTC